MAALSIWVILGVLFGGMGLFLFGWLSVPWNKAKLYRSLSPKKNWRVVQLVMPGGQVRFKVIPADQPVVTTEGYSFPLAAPDAKRALNHIGSVPYQTFSTEDTNPIFLSAKAHTKDEPFRNPSHLTNFLMLMKAFYEAMASRNQDLLKVLVIVAIIFAAIACVLSFQTMNGVNEVKAMQAAEAAFRASSGGLVNQLG